VEKGSKSGARSKVECGRDAGEESHRARIKRYSNRVSDRNQNAKIKIKNKK
jgi:hypothetical protein